MSIPNKIIKNILNQPTAEQKLLNQIDALESQLAAEKKRADEAEGQRDRAQEGWYDSYMELAEQTRRAEIAEFAINQIVQDYEYITEDVCSDCSDGCLDRCPNGSVNIESCIKHVANEAIRFYTEEYDKERKG